MVLRDDCKGVYRLSVKMVSPPLWAGKDVMVVKIKIRYSSNNF